MLNLTGRSSERLPVPPQTDPEDDDPAAAALKAAKEAEKKKFADSKKGAVKALTETKAFVNKMNDQLAKVVVAKDKLTDRGYPKDPAPFPASAGSQATGRDA